MLSDLGSIATILTFLWLVWPDKSKHPTLKRLTGKSTVPGWIVVLDLVLYRALTEYLHVDFVVLARGRSILTNIFNLLITPAGNYVLWAASVAWIAIAALWVEKKNVDQRESTASESLIVPDPGKQSQEGKEPLSATPTETLELNIEHVGTRIVSVSHFPYRDGMLSERGDQDYLSSGFTIASGSYDALIAKFRTTDSFQSIVAHIDYSGHSTKLQIDHGLWLHEPRNNIAISPGKTAELVLFIVDVHGVLYAIEDLRGGGRTSASWQRKLVNESDSYRIKITLVEEFGKRRLFELQIIRSGLREFQVPEPNSRY